MGLLAATRHALSAAAAHLREGGPAAIAWRVGKALLTREHYVLLRRRVSPAGERRTTLPVRGGEIRFEVIEGDRADAVPREGDPDRVSMEWPEARDFLEQRLAKGEALILGRLDGRIVWKSWACREDWRLKQCRRAGGIFEMCHCSLRCLGAYRRRGVASAALRFLEGWARDRGYRDIWVFVRRERLSSLRLHESLGYERFGSIEFCEVLGLRRVRFQRPGGALRSFAAAMGA